MPPYFYLWGFNMTGQEMIDMCSAIIKRQDLNTNLLLMFINQQRKFILRSNYLYKLQQWITGFEPEDGFVTTDLPTTSLKQARYVEWNPNPEDNVDIDFNTNPDIEHGVIDGRAKKLLRLNTIQEAFDVVENVDAIGEPQYYVVMSGGIKVIPAPPVGTINIFGEWYPSDYYKNSDDDNNLSQEDILAKEIGDIVVYNSCAEYFDFLEEFEKAQMWRNKGKVLLDEYFKEIKRQMTDDRYLMERDPFGNLGIHHGWFDTNPRLINVNELTGGTAGNTYHNG